MTTKELLRLFRPEPRLAPFEDELAAVVEGRKAMTVLETSKSNADPAPLRENQAYLRSRALANRHSLLWIERNVDTRLGELIRIFVLPPAEEWRVHAYELLYRAAAMEGWGFALERMKSELLGYSKPSIDEWIASLKRTSCGWGMLTAYLLLADQHVATLEALGFSSLPIAPVQDLGRVFVLREQELAPVSDCRNLLGTVVLARFGARYEILPEVFGRQALSKRVTTLNLDDEVCRKVNRNLMTKIEMWNGETWATPR